MSPKPPRPIPRERTALAREMFLEGKSRQKITRALCDAYGVGTRTARRYIQLVTERLEREAAPTVLAAERARAEHLLLEALDVARAEGDAKTMAYCAERVGKLNGLFVERVQVSGSVAHEHTHHVDLLALRDRILALRAGPVRGGVAGGIAPALALVVGGGAGGPREPGDPGGD